MAKLRRRPARRPARAPELPPALARLIDPLRATLDELRRNNVRIRWTPELRTGVLRTLDAGREHGVTQETTLAALGIGSTGVLAPWPEYRARTAARPRAARKMRAVEIVGNAGPGATNGGPTLTTPSGFTLTVRTVAELVELLRALGGP